ncbi:MAG: peptide chain release factor N(5)-glutamine methyltransferase [Clostridia bacterium]|nr:peptide chain release factor N(5)-glutamine methyltransferase [Clostridia bacterium]
MVIRQLLASAEIDRLDAEVLLSHVLGVPREKLLFLYSEPVPDAVQAAFVRLCEKRKTGCPLSYILGEKEFYSLPFFVNEHTLIPRPDTELLVEWAIEKAKGARVLDLCSGSGCIGIAVAKNAPVRSLTLADISKEALEVSKRNAARHGVEAEFIETDILKDDLSASFDLILSNPPYIETDVIQTLEKDVRDFEPLSALDGGNDGLGFYPVIAEKAFRALPEGGWLGLEIGYNQGAAVSAILAPYFENIRILYDLGGNARCVVGRKSVIKFDKVK